MWKELYSISIVKVKDLIFEEEQSTDQNDYCTSHHIKYNFIHTHSIKKTISPSEIAEITSKTESGGRESCDVYLIMKKATTQM